MKETEQRWLLNLVKEDLLKQNEAIKNDIPKSRKPTSRYQGLLIDFYKELKTVESADGFDKWFENNDLKYYTQTSKLIEFFEEITKKLQLTVEKVNYSDYGNYDAYREAQIQKLLFAIAERYLEEPEPTLNVIKNAINEKYPNLVEDEQEVELERYEQEYKQFVEKELEGLKEQLEQSKEVLKEEIKKIETAKTDIEKICLSLNSIIYLGIPVWKLIIYSIMSPYCPKIKIDGLPTRANIHTMFVGDPSSGKSKTLNIIQDISPKVEWFTRSTLASLEGIATRSEIEKGVLDNANNGVLIIRDFEESNIPTIREILDSDKIKIIKAGIEKEIENNITLIIGENPIKDYFVNSEKLTLREQIDFTEALLSRFIIIPSIVTKLKNEMLLEKINIFSEGKSKMNLEEIKEILTTRSVGMKDIKQVMLTENQKEMLKNTFLEHNIEIDDIPLLTLRSLEDLCRLVNIIVTLNFHKRKIKDNTIYSEDEDIEEAIELFEIVIDLKKTLYRETQRLTILTIEEKLLINIVQAGGKIETQRLVNIALRENLCGKSTVYKIVKRLEEEGKIKKNGLRNSELIVI